MTVSLFQWSVYEGLPGFWGAKEHDHLLLGNKRTVEFFWKQENIDFLVSRSSLIVSVLFSRGLIFAIIKESL